LTRKSLSNADKVFYSNINQDGGWKLSEMTRWGEYYTRLVDISVGLAGTGVFLFLFPIIGFLIRLDSPGPILYRASRVGRRGRLFTMYKFRSMYIRTEMVGASVTPQGDPRITQVGRWLRRTKLDEFPQFLNILKGDMTLVGPRPEAADIAADYPEGAKQVFEAKPGLIGPNQIIGRNEEEWYPPGVDHRKYYLEEILPGKVANDLEYLQKKSFWGDLKLLAAGVWATVSGVAGHGHLTDKRTQI
jgi:lipopolysaccharide/colanic/teichoic acid biosynthesis glycosyltransferase